MADEKARDVEARLFAVEVALKALLLTEAREIQDRVAAMFDEAVGRLPQPDEPSTHDMIVRARAAFRVFQKGYRLEKPNGQGMSEEDMDIYRFIIDFEDGERRKNLARMQPDWVVKRSVEKALHSEGVRLAADDPARRELELKFLEADRRAIDLIKARLAGEVIPTPEAAGESPDTNARGL